MWKGMERLGLVAKSPLDSAIPSWLGLDVASLRAGCLVELQGCLGLSLYLHSLLHNPRGSDYTSSDTSALTHILCFSSL